MRSYIELERAIFFCKVRNCIVMPQVAIWKQINLCNTQIHIKRARARSFLCFE
jgi:hypothetical protein